MSRKRLSWIVVLAILALGSIYARVFLMTGWKLP